MLNRVGWLVIGILVAAAAYELSLALRHAISPDGESFVLLIALLAMLAGAVLVFRGGGAAGLFAPAAALFVTARFFTGDPNYAPSFVSYLGQRTFSPAWAFGLLGLSLVAGLTTHLWRRTAPVESAAVILFLMFPALFMGAGY